MLELKAYLNYCHLQTTNEIMELGHLIQQNEGDDQISYAS